MYTRRKFVDSVTASSTKLSDQTSLINSFVFFQHLPMVLDQHQEDVESPGRQGDDLLVSDNRRFSASKVNHPNR
jgi:hypothetical protein